MTTPTNAPAPALLGRYLQKLTAKSSLEIIPAIRAVGALARRQPGACQQALDPLLRLLSDHRVSVVESACEALADFDLTDHAISRLREVARKYHRVHVRDAAHRTLLGHWAKSPPHDLKPEANAIAAHLGSNGIRSLYHVTTGKNLKSIEAEKAILSRAELERRKITGVAQLSDTSSRKKDDLRLTSEWVRLCFHPNQPMFSNALRYRGAKDLVVLEVLPEVATWRSTLFTQGNAVDCWAAYGPDLADLASINLNIFSQPSWTHADKHNWQSEVLVHSSISTSMITRVSEFADVMKALWKP